jgi:diketogulonate reductase-like aldo/keto reductase/polysaccharide pyruvyl transferase WcaK-like protein
LNKGSAALLNSKIKLLSVFIPGAKFVVSTHHPEIDYTQYDVKMVKVAGKIYPLKIMVGQLGLSVLCGLYSVLNKYLGVKINISIQGKKLQEYASQSTAKARAKDSLGSFSTLFLLFRCTLWAMLHKFGLNMNRSFCGKKLQEYYGADIVLNTSGDVLTEDYGLAFSHFVNLLFAILLDKPVIICAESIGPFKNRWYKFIARYVLNRAKLITLREERSLKHLQEIGVNKPPIYVTADVAFVLEPPSDQRIKEILTKEGIKECMPLIGISVSKIISNYGFPELKNRKDKYNEYVKLMSKSIDYLVETLNATIVFVPHVIGPGEGNDDRTVADDIYKLIKNRDKVVSIKEEYTPEELKGIIGQCDLFIGARMHATIASTSMLVPTVAIAYSDKTHGIIGKMLGYETHVLDVKDLSYDMLISKIKDAWESREEIKKDLEMKISKIKEKAMLNGKLIKDYIDVPAVDECIVKVEKIVLNNGIEMPMIGLGTYPTNGVKLALLVRKAVKLGYRSFDTASAYGNEKWLGIGIRLSGVKRSDLFITTKASNAEQRTGDVISAVNKSKKRLGVKQVDLYLMHWPNPDTYLKSWKQMETLYKEGVVRAIGVCNFHEHHLLKLLEIADVIPVINQFELHPLLSQTSLVKFCHDKGIRVTAYSPLARMNDKLRKNTTLVKIAGKYQKTVPQIILRWNFQNHIISIPKTSNPARLKENIDIFDFSLSEEEMNLINQLNINFRVRFDPDNCDFNKL